MRSRKNITVPIILATMVSLTVLQCTTPKENEVVNTKLNEWLAKDANQREPLENLDFAKAPLTKNEAENAIKQLFADKQTRMLSEYEAQWDNRLLRLDEYEMPFYYNIFGDEPADGRSLFISMHGGGGTTAEANDQQYENQKHLYDATMDSLEGVYLSPRAATNAWNLWHQPHIDDFFNIIIQMAVVKLNVNPDKVYLLGYSAGGDGVYQMGPRLADRWAAASMMAGHPNDASPLNLRNTPFAIHMGALDDAYNRNLVAREWGNKLDSLQLNDPQGYIHDVQIHEGLSHWMKLEDAVALPWMQNYQRNPIPEKVVWELNQKQHSSFYWLGVPENNKQDKGLIVAEYNKDLNEINIIENSSDTLQLLINDDMLDLDNPITIKYQGNEIARSTFNRSVLNIYNSINTKGDSRLAFPGVITVVNNERALNSEGNE